MASVLIIDSNVALSAGIADYLESLGFDVFQATRGDKGLELAIEKKPSLILVDGVMPDKTGLQMCNQFRTNPATRDTPIILMSGLATFENQQQFARERGVNEYIPKPLKIIELGEMVTRYIGPKMEHEEIPPLPARGHARGAPIPMPQAKSGDPISDQLRFFLRNRLNEAFVQPKNDPTR